MKAIFLCVRYYLGVGCLILFRGVPGATKHRVEFASANLVVLEQAKLSLLWWSHCFKYPNHHQDLHQNRNLLRNLCNRLSCLVWRLTPRLLTALFHMATLHLPWPSVPVANIE